jgi:hypothetical protein
MEETGSIKSSPPLLFQRREFKSFPLWKTSEACFHSDPLSSLLSLGGERKITVKGIHRKIASPRSQ